MSCHSERSEEPLSLARMSVFKGIPRFARNDKVYGSAFMKQALLKLFAKARELLFQIFNFSLQQGHVLFEPL